MDLAKAFSDVLPPLMHDPVMFAVPFFLLLLIIEWAAARKLAHDEGERPPSGAYLKPDAWASVWMGLVSVGTSGLLNGIALVGYAALYVYVAPWHLPASEWYTWVIAIVGVDLLYYLYHRMAHRVRIFWATHQAHHSSQYFNFATALRQKWNISGDVFLRALLPLFGVPPWLVFLSFSINLIYQFWIHTERIDRLWGPIEFVFNTPSHHHHGMDRQYLTGTTAASSSCGIGCSAASRQRTRDRTTASPNRWTPTTSLGCRRSSTWRSPRMCVARRGGATGSATSSGRRDGCPPAGAWMWTNRRKSTHRSMPDREV